ncbi:UbiA family prenyltransferase [Gandjariella thermophila]|uniref:4-hydroxybenzoate polyprenyltransferase n=1 Tax=Gandjariella thermophila TaxID=1931992 RepID=A0A4D4J9A9_9PSEU|nr:UbiA family prenyltransferase [Gandjariella thermophila]GDY31590.1 hypothetical protein GTS_32230 [Gandjariella thermophila]
MSTTLRARPHSPRWRDVVLAHRLEYPFPLRYLCYALWGACYVATRPAELVRLPVLLAVLANLVQIMALNMLNTAVDVRTDARNPGKSAVARAALRIGPARAAVLAGVELAVGLLLAGMVVALTGHWLVAAAAALVAALHLLYNVEPVRLKRRAPANPLALGLSVGFLPCLVSAGAVRALPGGPAWLVFAGFGVLVAGRALWWSVPDRAADAAAGLMTPPARFGGRATIDASGVLTGGALALLGAGLALRYGAAVATVGTAATAAASAGVLALLYRYRAQAPPSARHLRTHVMPLLLTADLLLVALPLAGG